MTSLSRAEARNFGFDQGLDHDLPYERAQEFVEAAVALWESWEPDARSCRTRPAAKEAFMEGFLEPYFTAMDPNGLLCMAWKWQHGDVARHTGGDLAAALGRSEATTRILPISEDMFFPVRDHETEQALTPNSELRVIDDVLGHLGLFGVAPTYIGQVDGHLNELLATR